MGEAQPDRSLSLDQRPQRAIVDQRGADRGNPARRLERRALNQHAAARCRSKRRAAVHPVEGIKHHEIIDESRDQHALGPGLAMQLGHERHQLALLAPLSTMARNSDKPAQCIGRVFDIGVGEPDVLRGSCVLDSLRNGPELAGPAGCEWLAGEDCNPSPLQGRGWGWGLSIQAAVAGAGQTPPQPLP